MDIPDKIKELAEIGLIRMYEDARHHFDWRIRRDMYRQFATHPIGYRAHGLLAILAAEYVLPIYTTIVPTDDLPMQLLTMARRVVEGKATKNSEEYFRLHDDGHHQYLEWLREVSIAAEYAGFAPYKALVEVGGNNMLERVETLRIGKYKSGQLVMSIGATEEGAEWEEGSTFTDEDIAHLAAYCDTASTAAMASAYAETQLDFNPKSLRSFWEWWVNQALPQAWQNV